jgi:hypothetical protein
MIRDGNFMMDVREAGCENEMWMELVQNRVHLINSGESLGSKEVSSVGYKTV